MWVPLVLGAHILPRLGDARLNGVYCGAICHLDAVGIRLDAVTQAIWPFDHTHAPVLHDHSLNLSILLSDGAENNYDSSSNGERTTIPLHMAALSAGHFRAHLCGGYGKGLLKGSLPLRSHRG